MMEGFCEKCGSPKGVYCHYKSGCKYDDDCKYAEDNFDEIINSVPCITSRKTGSRYICTPPVTNTDDDWIFNCSGKGQMKDAHVALKKHGFYIAGMREGGYYQIHENFTPYRLGHLNFILCNSQVFYNRFELATETAAALNLLKKADRITLFQAILYGNVDGKQYKL